MYNLKIYLVISVKVGLKFIIATYVNNAFGGFAGEIVELKAHAT